MTEHTKEPLFHDGDAVYNNADCVGDPIVHVMSCAYDNDLNNMDARRIVAAVNACAGLQTEYLEKVGLPEFSGKTLCADTVQQELDRVTAQRDQLAQQLANLERLTGVYFPRGQELRREDHQELFKALQEQQPTPPSLPDLNGQFVKGGAERDQLQAERASLFAESQRKQQLEQQRDQLLAALEAVRNAGEWYTSAIELDMDIDGNELLEVVDQAIAAVKGK